MMRWIVCAVVKGPVIEELEKHRDAELTELREKRQKAAEEKANKKKDENKDDPKVN